MLLVKAMRDSHCPILFLNSVTPSIIRKNVISDACTYGRTLLVITQDLWPWMRMGIKTVLKNKRFAFFDNSRFMTAKPCKAPITALALPIRASSSSSCLPSLVNATPRYLNFSICFSVGSFTCKEHWSRFLERWSTSVLAALIFIPTVSRASAKLFNAPWRPDFVKESRTVLKVDFKNKTTLDNYFYVQFLLLFLREKKTKKRPKQNKKEPNSFKKLLKNIRTK